VQLYPEASGRPSQRDADQRPAAMVLALPAGAMSLTLAALLLPHKPRQKR